LELREVIRLSWSNIRSHKLRNFLAVLSVTIGIAAVIAVVTMTTGLQSSLLNTLTQDFLRADTITVGVEGDRGFFGTSQVFSQRDIDHLKAMPGIKAVDVLGTVRGDTLYFEGQRLLSAVTLVTTNKDFMPVDWGHPVEGLGDVIVGVSVAKAICEKLLRADQGGQADEDQLKTRCEHPGKDEALAKRILGQTLHFKYLSADKKVQETDLTVVGLVKDSQFISGDIAYVSPIYHSDTEKLDGQEVPVYSGLLLKVDKIDNLTAMQQTVKTYFDSYESDARKLLGAESKINVNTFQEIVDEIKKNFGQVTGFLGAIAVVALLVGMIGVMNIMLITVKERTREIGVMKATGATNGGVLRLFLSEAVLICLIGAVLGVLVGMGLSVLFIRLTMALFSGLQEVPFVLVYSWYAIAILTGMVVGVISGVYPAWSAARTNPIEALRYE
jgi:putative ABC transport system permease protein